MRRVNKRSVSKKTGSGLISSAASLPGKAISVISGVTGTTLNRAEDLLPSESHIPGYQYCGPGTKLEKRLKIGDPGINPLDKACKEHDIAYNTYKDTQSRAEKVLAERAWQRVKAPDSSIAEKAAVWAATNAMKLKSKFDGRLKRSFTKRRTMKKRGAGVYLEPFRSKTGCGLKRRRRLTGRKRHRNRRRRHGIRRR